MVKILASVREPSLNHLRWEPLSDIEHMHMKLPGKLKVLVWFFTFCRKYFSQIYIYDMSIRLTKFMEILVPKNDGSARCRPMQ